MNWMKFVSFKILFFVTFFLTGCETPKSYYPTLKSAEKDGAIQRGWIPSILPSSSNNIYEQHDIDTNDVWIKSTFNEKDKEDFLKYLTILTPDEIRKISIRTAPKKNRWWDRNINTESIRDAGEKFPYLVGEYRNEIRFPDSYIHVDAGYFFINMGTCTCYYTKYSN